MKTIYTLDQLADLRSDLHDRAATLRDFIVQAQRLDLRVVHKPDAPVDWLPHWLIRQRHEDLLAAGQPSTLNLPAPPELPTLLVYFDHPGNEWPDPLVAHLSGHAHQQLCTRLRVPVRLARRTAQYYPTLYTSMMLTWLQHDDAMIMVRTRLADVGGLTVRSMASNRYLRFDHKHMVDAAVVAAELLEVEPRMCTLSFSSDRDDMWVYAHSKGRLGAEGELSFAAGAIMENSEVGRSAIKLTPFLYIGLGDGLYISIGSSTPWSRRHVTSVRDELGEVFGDDPAIEGLTGKLGEELYRTAAGVGFEAALERIAAARTIRYPRIDAAKLAELAAMTQDLGETLDAALALVRSQLPTGDVNTLFHAGCAVATVARMLEIEHPEKARLMRYAWSVMTASRRSKIHQALEEAAEPQT